jgi:hypothetical protein
MYATVQIKFSAECHTLSRSQNHISFLPGVKAGAGARTILISYQDSKLEPEPEPY